MKYVEEHYAAALYSEMAKRIAENAITADLNMSGGGVNRKCFAECGTRSCTVHCFSSQGPEYLVFFEQEAHENAAGRTASTSEATAAVVCWLEGNDLTQMYARFKFVDEVKRTLLAIAATAFEHCSELERLTTYDLQYYGSAIYKLKFKAIDRSCNISFWGKNRVSNCVFQWDESEMFRVPTDNYASLAVVLQRWLCDYAPPSSIRAEFDWIEMGPLADYYEQGRPIEGEFIESWNGIERFYQDKRFSYSSQVLTFITEIRRAGYDNRLRTGASLWSLIVSRSRRHGLRRGNQPYIVFGFPNGSLEVTSYVEGQEKFTLPEIAFTPQIAQLLERLTRREID